MCLPSHNLINAHGYYSYTIMNAKEIYNDNSATGGNRHRVFIAGDE
ncbi:hypothetical protein J45TS6_12110 [Paenibacillus sp. J45TS6]|nr:hypothetical protein J45TS6_12110 [Paenibacillus sp. J45TS6]